MAVDMFLKLEGVLGQSKNRIHSQEMDVLSWSWRMGNSGSAHVGGGAGRGSVNMQDALPDCRNGTHYKSALITVRKVGGNLTGHMKIKLEPMLISGVSKVRSRNGDRLTENIILRFGKVSVDSTPQKDEGSAGAANPFGWYLAANSKE